MAPPDMSFPWCLGLYPIITEDNWASVISREDCGCGGEEQQETSGGCESSPPGESESDDDATGAGHEPECHFMSQLQQIPEGTVLYDVYCLPSPDAALDPTGASMQRIGRIRTASPLVRSSKDRHLYFKHQRREEDYELRPYWTTCIVQTHAETGASYFDNAVPMQNYCNFELSG